MKKGWLKTTLGEICEISTGKSNTEDAIENGSYAFFDRSKKVKTSSKYLFDCDAIIVAGEGQTFLPKFYSGKFDLHQRAYAIFNFKKNISVHYVYKYLIHFHKYFELVAVGATAKSLRLRHFQDLPLPFPSLKEQEAIVEVLDKAFEEIDQATQNAQKNIRNAKDLFESYSNSTFSLQHGSWQKKTLNSLTTKIGSGATPRGGNESYKATGLSLIRSMNVHDRSFRNRGLAYIDEEQARKLDNVTVQSKDILLNITGASVTRCCIIPDDYLPARVNQHVSIIRPNNEISPKFLCYLLTSNEYKSSLLKTGEEGGATRQAITKQQLENFVIAFPKSLDEQEEIVQKLDELQAETRQLEQIYQQKINCLEELKQSILQKAFSGELLKEASLV